MKIKLAYRQRKKPVPSRCHDKPVYECSTSIIPRVHNIPNPLLEHLELPEAAVEAVGLATFCELISDD